MKNSSVCLLIFKYLGTVKNFLYLKKLNLIILTELGKIFHKEKQNLGSLNFFLLSLLWYLFFQSSQLNVLNLLNLPFHYLLL